MKRNSLVLVLGLILVFSVSLVLGGCGERNESEDVNSTSNVAEGENNDHEHGEFEWIGEFEFKAGTYLFHFGACEDETMDVGFIKMGENVTDLEHHASHIMASEKETIKQDSTFEAKPDYAYTFEMDKEHGHIHFTIAEDGTYAIVTEHHPSESSMQIFDENDVEIMPVKEHEGADHSH